MNALAVLQAKSEAIANRAERRLSVVMTLDEWATLTGIYVDTHGAARIVHDADLDAIPEQRWKLYRLTDYVVSSVTGGSVWLVRREK